MNAGAVNLTSNSSEHLIKEYASMLLAEGHTLNIVTELGRAYAFQKLNFNFKVFILKELTKCKKGVLSTPYITSKISDPHSYISTKRLKKQLLRCNTLSTELPSHMDR